MTCFCTYPQCMSSAYVGGVYVILILRAWQISHKGQQSLTKLNAKQAADMSGSFTSLNNMYGFGRNSSFIIQELIMQHLSFLKDKSLEFQCHLEQDKQQLKHSHIISVNYLDLDQAYATQEFQVQSKSLYQSNFIQNLGEFKVENQVLERNYNRSTIHHFPFKRLF